MQIKLWIRTASAEDETPTMRIDTKWESRDTPRVQHYGRKLLRALGYDETNEGPLVIQEANGDIVDALHTLAAGNWEQAKKAVADGDLAQMFLDAAKIVEAWSVEHGDIRAGGDAAAVKTDGGAA